MAETKHTTSGERKATIGGIVTGNRHMRSLMRYAGKVAPYADVVRISGEGGTGKELFAKLIHEKRKTGKEMVKTNVAGLDDHFFSDDLFGHIAGAYTGADKGRPGLAMKAYDSTLFLDEIGDLGLSSQVKLLRMIQEEEILPLGADDTRKVKLFLIVATNRPLRQMVLEGKFRKDLYFRLDTHHIHIPPLRERLDDLPLLAAHFAEEAASKLKTQVPEIGGEALRLMRGYPFPGNVRELKSMIEYATLMGDGELDLKALKEKMKKNRILAEDMADADRAAGRMFKQCPNLPSLKEAEKALFNEALRRTGGNQTHMAEILGISQPAVSKRVRNPEKQRKSPLRSTSHAADATGKKL